MTKSTFHWKRYGGTKAALLRAFSATVNPQQHRYDSCY
ncbi:hypothetical protein GCK32_015620 [Trichostrongylus colubriformis]|uniref:Uncharacterized protein n=1 Tax=Trichostrongylus colubriformis TaxID=6319 RepID=A0AAN8FU81_TRICO